MFTTGSKFLIGASVLATISAIAYGVAQDGVMGTVGLASAAVALAFLAGINIALHKISVYVLNALLVCLAALILISRTGSALPGVGIGLELKSIAAAIIGGVSLTGGYGSLPGIFLGAFLLGLIQNMLNILNLSAHFQSVVLGIIIVTAVTIGKKK